MYVTWKNKEINLYNDNKQFIRKMRTLNDVQLAVINGANENPTIAVTQQNGKTVLYNSKGQIIRKQS